MSALTPAEIQALSLRVQNFTPDNETRTPPAFLSLAPTTSASYPQQKTVTQPKLPEPAAKTVAAGDVTEVSAPTGGAIQAPLVNHRRSSSSTSEGSSGSVKHRFLKLGPVHWGEGDGTGDWSEVGVVEE